MRIRPKRIHSREDCFAAAEGVSSVRIAAHRHTVLISATDDAGRAVTHELSLPVFAEILVAAVRKDIGLRLQTSLSNTSTL